MSPDIIIRRESPDQPDVIELLGALDAYLATLYPPEANHILGVQALLAPDVHFWVARFNATGDAPAGELVGTGAVRRRPAHVQTEYLPYGEIKRMMVRPGHRGKGIAQRLLSALEADMREAGMTLAVLETGHKQAEAVRLYERSGYLARGPFGGYHDNGLSAFYEKRL